MRAKLKINSIDKHDTFENIKFNAVCKDGDYPEDGSDEDNSYAKWTPTADLQMAITNPNLLNKFEVGQKFYVDFTKAE